MKAYRGVFRVLFLAWICLAMAAGAVPGVSALAQEAPLPGEQLGIKNISDYIAQWRRLYNPCRDAVNTYNRADPDMALTPLDNAEIPFILADLYDALPEGQEADGRYEGILDPTGMQGYLEKSGHILSFGRESVRDWDGLSIAAMKGDLELEEGSLDLRTGHMIVHQAIRRGEADIEWDYYEYKLLEGGGMHLIAIWGDLYDAQGMEVNRTVGVYMRLTEAGLAFFTARGSAGAAFTPVALGEGEWSLEEAIQAFAGAGLAVEKQGSVNDGAVEVR